MAYVTRCDQCGKLDDMPMTPRIGDDRNRIRWPWLRVSDRGEGDGYEYDFCSPACMATWSRRLAGEIAKNKASDGR